MPTTVMGPEIILNIFTQGLVFFHGALNSIISFQSHSGLIKCTRAMKSIPLLPMTSPATTAVVENRHSTISACDGKENDQATQWMTPNSKPAHTMVHNHFVTSSEVPE